MRLFKKNVEDEVIEPTVFADSPGAIVYHEFFDDTEEKIALLALSMCLLVITFLYYYLGLYRI